MQTISGKGEMTVSVKISRLDASAPHALVAAPDAPLVVLVHYLKGGAALDDHHHGH